MAGNPQFNQRSDNAALRLKAEINDRNGLNLESSPVAVGPDGKPPAPPPPEGSYMRAAYDQQQQQLRAENAQAAPQAMGQPTPEQVLGQQPPMGTPDQQGDASQAPPLAGGVQQPVAPAGSPQDPPVSENANRRIQGLINDVREKDARIAELAASAGEVAQLREQVQAMQAEREQFLQSNLDSMDPETRAQVMAEARFRELLAANNQQLMEQLQPQLSTLHQQNAQTELERIAEKYPGFNLEVHPVLMDQLRAKVPGLTMEMAFKAVAEGDEAIPRDVAAQVAVPPVTPAGNGAPLPRYMPEPQADPTEDLRDFQRRTNELIASQDPAKQRQGYRQLDDVLGERLRGANYPGKPTVF